MSETFIIPDRPPKQGFSVDIASGLALPAYDYVSMALSGGNATETWTFKRNGATGVTIATITIVYTDSTRAVISTVTKQ